jgi:hypothetical protein
MSSKDLLVAAAVSAVNTLSPSGIRTKKASDPVRWERDKKRRKAAKKSRKRNRR